MRQAQSPILPRPLRRPAGIGARRKTATWPGRAAIGLLGVAVSGVWCSPFVPFGKLPLVFAHEPTHGVTPPRFGRPAQCPSEQSQSSRRRARREAMGQEEVPSMYLSDRIASRKPQGPGYMLPCNRRCLKDLCFGGPDSRCTQTGKRQEKDCKVGFGQVSQGSQQGLAFAKRMLLKRAILPTTSLEN